MRITGLHADKYSTLENDDGVEMKEVQKASDMQIGGDHYIEMGLQPWTVMQAILTPEEFRGFLRGNVVKYAMRAGRKPGSDDAGKARHYIQKLKEFDEEMHQMRDGKT